MACRYNTYLEIQADGLVRFNRPGAPEHQDPLTSCALDIAERGPSEQSAVAATFGIGIERVRQIERAYESALRQGEGGATLRALLGAMAENQSPDGVWPEGDAAPMRWYGEPELTREEQNIEAWAVTAAALIRAGIPARAAWTIAGHEPDDEGEDERQDEDMAKIKGKGVGGHLAGSMERGSYTMSLPVEATADEIDKAAKTQARLRIEYEEIDADRVAAAKAFREKLSTIEEQLTPLAQIVFTGTRPGDVKVTEYLLPTNEIQIVRDDTSEVVERRKPEADDLFGKRRRGKGDEQDSETVE